MNLTRIALAALAALVAYFIVGGIFFAVPAMKTEFARYPAIFRSGDDVLAIDTASTNGTWRGRTEIQTDALRDPDSLQLAKAIQIHWRRVSAGGRP